MQVFLESFKEVPHSLDDHEEEGGRFGGGLAHGGGRFGGAGGRPEEGRLR